jgi:hypothetical protein
LKNDLPPEIKSIIELSIVNWTQNNRKCKDCKRVSLLSSDQNYTIDEIIIYSNQVFQIIVEDFDSDRKFLDGLTRIFNKEAQKINEFKKNQKLEYFNGGGSTTKKILEAKIQILQDNALDPKKFNRLFILLDSDKRHPTEPYKNEISQIILLCETNNIHYHILEKREIENYLPEYLINKLKHANNTTFIEQFLRLEEFQKDYLDIEKGFNNKNFDSLDEEIKNFFSESDPNQYLRKHDWDRIAMRNSFKNFVSSLWNDQFLTKELFLARCLHHSDIPGIHPNNKRELPDLLKKISDLL